MYCWCINEYWLHYFHEHDPSIRLNGFTIWIRMTFICPCANPNYELAYCYRACCVCECVCLGLCVCMCVYNWDCYSRISIRWYETSGDRPLTSRSKRRDSVSNLGPIRNSLYTVGHKGGIITFTPIYGTILTMIYS